MGLVFGGRGWIGSLIDGLGLFHKGMEEIKNQESGRMALDGKIPEGELKIKTEAASNEHLGGAERSGK